MGKNMKNQKSQKVSFFGRIKNFFKAVAERRENEYSKRLLNLIVINSILMMWGTYILAWFGRVEIAEALSKTIATSIIAVVIGYLAKSVIENISKHTDTFGKNIEAKSAEDVIREAQERAAEFDDSAIDSENYNYNRDC